MGRTIHVGRDDNEIKIIDLAKILFKIQKYECEFKVKSAPVGSVMRRCPDIELLKSIGFKNKIELNEGLNNSVEWYKARKND